MSEASSRHRPEPRGITPATVLMMIAAVGFLVFCAATRWGLDLYGPWLAQHMGWLR